MGQQPVCEKLDLDQVIELTVPHLQKAGKVSEELSGSEQEWVRKLISLYQEQLSYGAEIVELTELFLKTISSIIVKQEQF